MLVQHPIALALERIRRQRHDAMARCVAEHGRAVERVSVGAGAASRFCASLAEHVVAGAPVILTIRADHLTALATAPDIGPIAERGLHFVTALTGDELRASIEGPARMAGLRVEQVGFYPPYADAIARCAEYYGVDEDRITLVNGLDEGLMAIAVTKLRPAAGGAKRARRARSAAEIKVSRLGPRAMAAIISLRFAKAWGVEYTCAPFSRGPPVRTLSEFFGGRVCGPSVVGVCDVDCIREK